MYIISYKSQCRGGVLKKGMSFTQEISFILLNSCRCLCIYLNVAHVSLYHTRKHFTQQTVPQN